MQSGTVSSNGIELFYESRGPENGEPIVFVMGLSAQMVFWPEPLLDALVERRYLENTATRLAISTGNSSLRWISCW